MKHITKILVLLLFSVGFSCEKNGIFVKCEDCIKDEPFDTRLEIRLDADINSGAIITVYEGNIEDNIIYTTFKVTTAEETSVVVFLNRKYTVSAKYLISDTNYIVVDSATPRVTYDDMKCDEPCYYIYDSDVDLKLKNRL